jgi:arginyl-tRNA synthetase
MPEVAKITKHIGHGMMRLSTGKMSSRTGDVITAESLIEQVVGKIKEKETEASSKKTEKEYEFLAVSAIKYMVLKHNIGSDIIFDFEQALSIRGDAAPYLQYTYARLRSILGKSGEEDLKSKKIDLSTLGEEEFRLIKQLLNFSDSVKDSAKNHVPNNLALYLYELATKTNYYYEKVRILSDETKDSERNTRLLLIEATAAVLKRGLNLLGIETLERV